MKELSQEFPIYARPMHSFIKSFLAVIIAISTKKGMSLPSEGDPFMDLHRCNSNREISVDSAAAALVGIHVLPGYTPILFVSINGEATLEIRDAKFPDLDRINIGIEKKGGELHIHVGVYAGKSNFRNIDFVTKFAGSFKVGEFDLNILLTDKKGRACLMRE